MANKPKLPDPSQLLSMLPVFAPMIDAAIGKLYMRWRWSVLFDTALGAQLAGRRDVPTSDLCTMTTHAAHAADIAWEAEKQIPFSLLPGLVK